MQRYAKILPYKIIHKFLGIFLLLILKFLSVYSINTDSLLNISLQNANFAGALRLVDQCRKQTVSKERNTALLLKQADIYLRLGNTDAAKNAMNEAEALFSKISYASPELEFQRALQKGRYFAFTGNQADELIWLQRAEKQIKYLNGNDPDDISRLYGELGSYYDDLSDYPAAIRYYQLAANRQKTDRVYGKIMQIYYIACLANDFWNRNETDKAIGLITPCLDYLDSTTDPYHPALLEVYFNVARYCINANDDYTTAEELLVKATRIMNKFFPPDHYLIGKLYFSKSQIEYAKSDYERALFLSLQVDKISNKYPVLIGYQVQNYYKLATIYYWYKHDYKKAIEICRLGIDKKKSVRLSSIYYLYMTGISYLRMSQIPLGMDYLRRAVGISSENPSPNELGISASANYEIAMIANQEKNITLTLHYLNEAIRILKKISNRNTRLTRIYYEMGRAYFMHTSDYHSMLNSVQLSIISGCKTFSDTMINANPPIADIADANSLIVSFTLKAYVLYLLYEKQPDKINYLELALECQEISVKLYERTLIDINDENSGLHMASRKVDDLNNAVSYSTLLYLRTKDLRYAEKALEYAEKSKMQILLIKTLKKNDLRLSGLPDSIINMEEKLTHEIFEMESRLALDARGGSFSTVNGPVLRKLTGFYDRRDVLINQIKEDYPAYYRAKYSFKLAGIKDIQRILDEDEVILEYQLLKTEIIIFVISRNDFNIHYQLIDKQVPENIRRLRNALASNPGSMESDSLFKAFTGSSFYLYQKLIEPVYSLIRNKRLIIIPHNDLTLIPFEVLISSKPEHNQGPDYKSLHYLIKEFPVAYAYSANLLLDNNQGKDFGRGTAVFLPDYKSYKQYKNSYLFPELQGAAAEAAGIKHLSHGKVLSGKQASETSFKSKANKYRVLHIGSHTLIDEKNPMLSCLVMTAPEDSAEDGFLHASEISLMNLKAQLVMLSGCNTGFGVLLKSEGLISIARSFFYTGVRSLAYTLWPVADKAGSDLTIRFYKEIRRHKTLDCALRDAKLKFLEEADPLKSHPFYWAGYVIVGKTNSVPLTRFPLWSKIMLASVLAAILAYLIFRKVSR